jgi:type III restriction enzyme
LTGNFLYRKLDVVREIDALADLPSYISENLSDHIVLRTYQEEAFRYFITYYENDNLRKNRLIHNLFHMATGSGKTVIMAGLILYLYTQGYRKFLFFVNQTNILEKTKENFLNPSSSKYLFARNVELFGDSVPIIEVENFAYCDCNAINLCFTTTQKLHMDLNFPKENSPTIDDFENDRVVLISDESHHINTRTKLNKTEVAEENSWEYSVFKIFHANKDNALLEFTATADLKDPNVLRKYEDKIVYDYTLSKFRESGYTKDFQNMQGDFSPWDRTLAAMVLSEYRRHLFGNAGQNIKPVVLLKSKTIIESEAFYQDFFKSLDNLSRDEILAFQGSDNVFLREAINYFLDRDLSLQGLISALQMGFSEDRSIIMNSESKDSSKENQIAVNSLEDEDNPYRIIFTVDMLNEGWDVLNLFDIVRLYEARDGKAGKPGKATIQEAQLIGRGARYCPFQMEESQPRFKRKYDYDLTNENRILETLLYHSMQDSRYISELRTALKQTGLLAEAPVEIEYKLKKTFKESDFYKTAYIFSNRKVEKSRNQVTQADKKIQNGYYVHKARTRSSVLYDLFGEKMNRTEGMNYVSKVKFKEIPLNITESAMANFEVMKFNVLKSYFPHLKSKREFLTSDFYLGNITIHIESPYKELTARDLYDGVIQALQDVCSYIKKIGAEYEGTKEFFAQRVHQVIRDKKIYIDNPHGDGVGISQAEIAREQSIELAFEHWYAYEDNFGTSEEKAFVKYFQGLLPELQKKYNEIYLIRNERIPALAIYDFDTGERFEPDFLLILQKKNADGYLQEQIYIEPKGNHLLEKDKWKEDFLLRIEAEGIPVKKYVDDNEYRIVGLPFFNQDYRMESFESAIK